MRSVDLNVRPELAGRFPASQSLAIYEQMSRLRYFEAGVINAVNRKEIRNYVYLSTGEEAVAAALSTVLRGYQIYAQHRSHDFYLFFGGSPDQLRDELLGLPSGCSGGRAGSNCLQFKGADSIMIGHHGLIGENVPLGVGAALGNGRKTLCIFGDGSAEEDYVLSAMGFAASRKLPVLFLCMDNDLSILTRTEVRRSWSIVDVARAFGMPAVDLADDPWTLLQHVSELEPSLPILINCRVCRAHWHVGVGTDGLPEWDRYELVKARLDAMGLSGERKRIEQEVKSNMEALWNQELSLRRYVK